MEKMDKIVLGGFGVLIITGTVATNVITDPQIASVVTGMGYVALILIIFLTDQLMRVEASSWPHIKAGIYQMDTGAFFWRSLFIGKPKMIGDGDLDPNGEYPFGWRVPLASPTRFPEPFGKVDHFYALTKKPFNENFNFVPTEEPIASWKGFGVKHGMTDGAFVILDPQPKTDLGKYYPVLLFKWTGVDALKYSENFNAYPELIQEVEAIVREKQKDDKNEVVTA